MTLAVVFRHAARRALDEAALWYEERRPGLGVEFVTEINRAVYRVAETPERFPIMHRDVRCIRARRFPYSVFFRAPTIVAELLGFASLTPTYSFKADASGGQRP